jgi:hypothetical protein
MMPGTDGVIPNGIWKKKKWIEITSGIFAEKSNHSHRNRAKINYLTKNNTTHTKT